MLAHVLFVSGLPSTATASCVQVDAICDVKEDLLKLAWQVAAPRERRVRGKRGLVDADTDHFAAVCRPVFPGSAPSSQVPWSGQHGGGSACGRCEGEGQREGLPERRVGKFEPRVRGPQGCQPGVVDSRTGPARPVHDVQAGQLAQADDMPPRGRV
jgi:hypothetical protein